MKVYIVTIHPTKASKSSYLLGAYSSHELATNAAMAETSRPDASYWQLYSIADTVIDQRCILPDQE
jgi:hypothetical protein